jgi:hypothetical protein
MEPFLSVEDSLAVLQSDRRERPRIPCDPPRPICLVARPQLERTQAYVCNFSARGIGIVTDRSFEVDTLVEVQLRRRPVGVSGVLTAKVIHRTEVSSGKWLLGCSLSRRLTAGELHGLRYG